MSATTRPDEPTVQKRRSDRIFIRIPLSVIGTDQNGQDFTGRAFTEMVSRFGASIITHLLLAPEQELTLIPAEKKRVLARVIGQTSISPEGHVYGIEFLNTTIEFWGIHFPPLAEAVSASIRLQCCNCYSCEDVRLSELEFEVFRANDRLRRLCSQCGGLTTWRPAEDVSMRKPPQVSVEPRSAKELGKQNLELRPEIVTPAKLATDLGRRMYPRLRVNLKACITQPGSADDIVSTINMSRGGVLVRSERAYPTDSWVQLAVPYTPAAANIFVPARVVWRLQLNGACQYGMKYVRG